MEPLRFADLPEGALLLMDTAPLIYLLEDHARQAARFRPLFEAHAAGHFVFAVTPITLAEVLAGPLRSGNEALARRYRALLQSWRMVELDADIAETAARLRATLQLKLPDALQAASALAVGAAALVTHDRDYSRLKALRVLC
jgi:predicted nucleic acid-binding protein